MIEVFILAIALSMDAFAVSIGLGATKSFKHNSCPIFWSISRRYADNGLSWRQRAVKLD